VRRLLQAIFWLSVVILLSGFVIPVLLSWFTDVISIAAVANWLAGLLQALVVKHDASPTFFQFLTLLIVGAPSVIILGCVGGLAYLGLRVIENSNVKVQDLEEQLERFLLIYDQDLDFLGRLRRLASKYDEERFQDFRRLVFKVVHQYCGEFDEGKNTFLLVPGDKAIISIENEEVCQAVLENLLDIKACQAALTTSTTQLCSNTRKNQKLIMTPTKWILPDCGSLLIAPLGGGAAKGILGVYHRKVGSFSVDVDQTFLELMAAFLSLAYAIRAKEVEI